MTVKKQLPGHLLFHLTAAALLLYLTLSLNTLRKIRCQTHPSARTPILSLNTATIARHARPLPACTRPSRPAKSYLIVFVGHSGSTALHTELLKHPDLLYVGMEPVDHQSVFNTTAALSTTREIFDRALAQKKIPGFKIRPPHILAQPKAWRELVEEYETRVIWQYRQNAFKAAVGEYSHRYLNDTSVVEGLRTNISRAERCRAGAGCSFRVENVTFLHGILKSMLHNQLQIAKAVNVLTGDGGCMREVPYEDYLYAREATVRDLFKFLGVPQRKSSPDRFKATGDNMCKVIKNWQEVCQQLYGCFLWQHMLDDLRNGCFCPYKRGSVDYCTL